MTYKYIRGRAGFVIWPEHIATHASMAKLTNLKPESAGFVGLTKDLQPFCYGESYSLGLPTGPDDTADLREQLGA